VGTDASLIALTPGGWQEPAPSLSLLYSPYSDSPRWMANLSLGQGLERIAHRELPSILGTWFRL
jgi:hypothetical protein